MNTTNPRFIDNGDGTVIDTTTRLQWSKATLTLTRISQHEALKLCEGLSLGGHSDLRLPTRAELLTLVDDTRHEPAIDVAAFPDTKSDWYLTSTVCAWSSAHAWCVFFGRGYCGYDVRGSSYGLVRAVRSVPADDEPKGNGEYGEVFGKPAAVPAGYVPASMLVEAREEIESWAAYATPYFQDKHDLAGVLAKIDGQIAAATPAPPAAPNAWEPSNKDYDRSIHSNPDAKAWADLFVDTFSGLADKHDLMLGWFANAMMAMHDSIKQKAAPPAEGCVVSEAMVESALKVLAFENDGAVFPDAYSDEEVEQERATMRKVLAAAREGE